MSKDRAAPFSRKHRRYWIPVTGGMILIGAINVGLGMCAYDAPPPPPKKIDLVIPQSRYGVDAAVDAPTPDAGDAGDAAAFVVPGAAAPTAR